MAGEADYQLMVSIDGTNWSGPHTVAEVRDMWTTGSVSAKTLVTVNGGEQLYLHEIRSTVLGKSPAKEPGINFSFFDHPAPRSEELLIEPGVPRETAFFLGSVRANSHYMELRQLIDILAVLFCLPVVGFVIAFFYSVGTSQQGILIMVGCIVGTLINIVLAIGGRQCLLLLIDIADVLIRANRKS